MQVPALEHLKLGLGLDALNDQLDLKQAGQHRHRTDDRLGRLGLDVLGEGPVDLDLVHRELAQIGQAGIAGAEVVQRDAHAGRRDVGQLLQRVLGLDDRALGDLDLEARLVRAFGKGRKERIVPLGRTALRFLEQRPNMG